MGEIRWRDWLILLLGLWLLASPWALGYSVFHTAAGNACGLGAALAIFNLMSVARLTEQGQDILNLVLAAWLLASPYALDYSSLPEATLNALAVGGAVIVLACWQLASAAMRPKPAKPKRR